MKNLTLGSLFDGSGGFPLAGLMAGITPIWNSEIEPFAIRVTEKRLPQVSHFGDVSALDGGKLPPVDIITFGSPCQDMSLAGKRAGLKGSRSNLFFQAIRIIKEMRCATNGKKPRYIVWENVPGAFSSNKGEDFRLVLESICKIKGESIPVPECTKWEKAGFIVAKDFSATWRVLDAQYWGVPQRRRRIFLVADFAGECGYKILFEPQRLSGNFEESRLAWQRTARSAEKSTGTAVCLNDQGSQHMDINKTTTITSTYGTGGNNHHLVVENIGSFDVRFTSENTQNARHNVYPTETARTLDTGGNTPDSNQGGVAVVAVQGSMIGRKDKNGPQGSGIGEKISFTLNTADRHAVAYGIDRSAFNQGKNAKFGFTIEEEKQPTIISKGGSAVAQPINSAVKYVVRRLTPTECARLQGFPDEWCENLNSANPTEQEILKWSRIFSEYATIFGKRPKSRNQVIKWLKNPYSDTAEYKLWGNGVALPCVYFVLCGIAWYNTHKYTSETLSTNGIDIVPRKS